MTMQDDIGSIDLGAFVNEHRSVSECESLRFEDFLPLLTHLKETTQSDTWWTIHPQTAYRLDALTRRHNFVFTDGVQRWTKPKPLSRKARLRMSRRRPQKAVRR